ncbi:MAG: cation:proton antiporter [Nanoarchaeota archaeon]|nr:cation:proton antiporter [Nanoarchaeota archaeon]
MLDLAILNGINGGLMFDIGLLIILATVFAYLAKLTRQPLIPAYVIAGIVLGPIGLGIIKDMHFIQVLSDIGIVFLLFIVGLEIDLKKLKEVGFVSGVGGIVQVVLTFFLGYVIANALGFNNINSIYTGLILAFSSTLVVIKLLSDREEVATLHGRLMVGFLLIQDILVIFALSFLSQFGSFNYLVLIKILAGALILFGLAALFNKYIVHRIFRFAAKSEELMFLLAITTCFLFVAISNIFGFSIAIGAFIGGVVLANLPYHYNIIGRVLPLKDFFSTIFFVSLGMQLALFNLHNLMKPFLIFLGVVIILKPIIIILILSMFGYGRRISFIAGIGLAQISEFALILIVEGKNILNPDIFTLTILLAVFTITITSYLLKYDEKIYNALAPVLGFLDKLSLKHQKLSYAGKSSSKVVILIGCHRMGSIILKTFDKIQKKVQIVDSNPDIIQNLIMKKLPCLYGDITNLEILKQLNFKKAKIIISTIPSEDNNLILLSYAKNQNPDIKVILTARHLHQALNLYEAGADYVIVPPIMSGERMAVIINGLISKGKDLTKLKNIHLKHLLEMNADG